MFKGKFFRKIAKMTALLAALLLVLSAAAPGAFALNGQNNKAFNYCGYQLMDENTIKVCLDKTTPSSGIVPVKEQFKIKRASDSADVPISTLTKSSGSGIGFTGFTQGTTVTLDTTNNFDSNTLYEVTVGNTVYANSGNTIGSFYQKHDVEFDFKSATVSGEINVTVRPMDISGGVPWEGNIGFTIDRPVASVNDAENILSGMALEKWNGSSWDAVILDDTVDEYEESGAEAYVPIYNTARTYFFYPLTANGNETVAYNLSSGQYRLTVPSFTIGGNSFGGDTYEFTTTTGDVPGRIVTAPTVTQGTPNDNQLSVSWSVGTVEPIASQYNVYYSTDKYWNFTQFGSTVSTTSTTITGLTNGQSYYVRITPVNGYGQGGFSLANDTAVAP